MMICYWAGRALRPSGMGAPDSVAALSAGDKIECGVDGIGTLKVSIGQPA
jgi:2-keto-4-pentenoate hydratase/2-oxohepta-3-ene-1,7-dioic acid hydratase in catechol pathway